MSIGLAGFETGIAIARQTGLGTVASTGWVIFPAEDTSGLGHGQQYIDRSPAYGLRTRQDNFRRRDNTMPGGDAPAWAIGFDGSSLALLTMLNAYYQNHTVTGAGTLKTWDFTTLTTNKAAANYRWYTVAQMSGLAGTRNPYLVDALAMGLGMSWSAGNAMTLTSSWQSLSVTHAGTPTGWGAAPTAWSTIGAAEQAWAMTIGGSSFTLYPSTVNAAWQYDAPDIAGAGNSGRARITPGVMSGECTLTIPRNTDVYFMAESAGDVVGTLVCTITPSGGYTTTVTQTGKIDRDDLLAGNESDVTTALRMDVYTAAWSVNSLLGTGAV